MEIYSLGVKKRNVTGSRKARVSRLGGMIPAILYGHGITPLPLEVKKGDLQRALHTKAGENVLIELAVEKTELAEKTCRIKDIQHHPVSGDIQHVDFTIISLKEKIEVEIPLVVEGAADAPGVKEGGVLDVVHHEIKIECLPTQIPENITVNIKQFKINDAIHVKELVMPEGVTCLLDPEDVVVTVHPPQKEEEPAAAEEGAPTQPEVIEKGKKEDAEEKAAAEPAEKEKKEKKDK